MLDRAWGGSFRRSQDGRHQVSHRTSRVVRRPRVEPLEGRQLLAASIASIADVSVPALVGYQVPVDGSASGVARQSFTVTSSNPDVKATVAQGAFVTVNVLHAGTTAADPSFSGAYTYQLFQDLTPNTANRIQTFTNAGGYNGSKFYRIATNFSGRGGPTDVILQGGPQPDTGTTNNPLELNQQLAFLEPGQIAIANGNSAKSTTLNTDAQQFFITTGPEPGLNFRFTIFGQVVAGQSLLGKIAAVPTTTDPASGFPSPNSPVTITSETVSNNNPNGVIHIDATDAKPGETSTVTVTATDPSDPTHQAVQTFKVTVGAPATTAPTTLAPSPTALTLSAGDSVSFKAPFNSNNLPNLAAIKTAYTVIVKPTHGTVTFDPATMTGIYVANPSFVGTDSFTYTAVNNNSTAGAVPPSIQGNPVTVTVKVTATTRANTQAVRVIGNVLVVTPPPSTLNAANVIVVSQLNDATAAANDKLNVTINGKSDLNEPLVSAIKRIVVYGSKANDSITVSPSVSSTIAVTLDGGHGGNNTLQAGAGTTREHGWFGQNTLAGGTGANQLIGRAGHVKFKPTTTTNEIFAGTSHPGTFNYHSFITNVSNRVHPTPGTFYKFIHGHTVPISAPRANQAQTTTTTTNQTVKTVSP